MLDGFYVGYMSGKGENGYGIVLFVIKQNNIVGVDAGGVKFDGTYSEDKEKGGYSGHMKVVAPPNIQLIQGINTGPSGLTYEVPLFMPANFVELPSFRVDTPLGPVNVRLERLRDLGAVA
jgi:hypothetical protein